MAKPENTPSEAAAAYLGLGSNLGDRKANIKAALQRLHDYPGITLDKYSSIYLTEPIGVPRQPEYYNAVARIRTTLPPHSLLNAIKSIERELGRQPDTHFQARPIDIDILLYGELEIDSLDLIIPHSRLTGRAFVLIPLQEINPNLLHPVTFKRLEDYIKQIYPPQNVERVIDAGKLFEPAP